MAVIPNLWLINLRTHRAVQLKRLLPSTYSSTKIRFYAADNKAPSSTSGKKITKFSSDKSYLDEILFETKKEEPKTTAQKVKKQAENTFLYAIVAASVIALGALGYYFVEQFLASDSPQTIYSKVLKQVQNDERCQETFGAGMKGYGEDTGRGRRRHIANQKYVTKEGEERVRVMFHIKGDRNTGKVFAEIAKRDGQWDYRFIYAVTDDTIPKSIILLDNRK
uniref:Mitochondrial import inner membrane translocase subunit Tim21 n=1 Tax=Panagrolaimus sp. PS1159 TaxID=55785 RepID=A0AC35GPF5_9BILA